MARSGVVSLFVVALALAGCTEQEPQAPVPPEELRQSVGEGEGPSWILSACDQFYFENKVPASVVRPVVPERFELYEFPPGIAYVAILATTCAGGLLDNVTPMADVDQVALMVAVSSSSGLELLALDWMARDAALIAAFADRGFVVTQGELEYESPVAGSPIQHANVQGSGGPKAAIRWTWGEGNVDDESTVPLLQDVDGETREVLMHLPGSYSTGVQYTCLVSPTDPLWSTLLGTPSECVPFPMHGDIVYEFVGPASA